MNQKVLIGVQINCRSTRQVIRRIGVLLPVLGLLGVALSAPRIARAQSGNSFLETMGISIAVGTVLGASTLPFYDQPGTHLMNLAYGASAGAVTGFGILVYGWLAGPSQGGYDEAEQSFGPGSEAYAQSRNRKSSSNRVSATYAAHNVHHLNLGTLPANTGFVPVRSAQFWMPVVSLNW